MKKSRPHLEGIDAPSFDAEWSRDWKRRFQLSWRSGDTDRRESTLADIVSDNAWRKQLIDVFENPANHGIVMPTGVSCIPPKLRLAMDETPLHYFPCLKGTFEASGVKNVHISHSNEKRMVTGSPITDIEGNVFLFQILWKGTSVRCHPKIGETLKPFISDLVVHDHAKKKNPNTRNIL